MGKRISYEIVPGAIFPKPPGMARASFRTKAKAQKIAEEMFTGELLGRLGLRSVGPAEVVIGGWQGGINPSSQVVLPARTRRRLMRACAAALGLIWRQDAVAISHLHPRGKKLAAIFRKAGGDAFTPAEAQEFYETLFHHDAGQQATIGFFEADGGLIFINGGDLSDDEFQKTMIELAERYLSDDIYLDLAHADLEIESSDWSTDHGEGYRKGLRECGRSDLLDWIEARARPQAERFIREFDWKADKGPPDRRS